MGIEKEILWESSSELSQSSLSEMEKEIIKKAYQEADPTMFSTIDRFSADCERIFKKNNKHLVKKPDRRIRKILKDDVGDVFFYMKREKGQEEIPSEEHLIALILKGVLPVSDIVYLHSGKLRLRMSKVMDLSRIEATLTEAQIRADEFLLSILFNDFDHDYEDNHNGRSENGKFVFFDFERGWFHESGKILNIQWIQENIKENQGRVVDWYRMAQRVQLLETLYREESGFEFFKTQAEKANYTPHSIEKSWKFFLERLSMLKITASALLAGEEPCFAQGFDGE